MSKATKRAKERYWLEPNNIETQEKYAAYVEGYQQTEKDLELSWEDIVMIDKLLIDLGMMFPFKSTPDYYQEVLKRFKEIKEQ